MNLTKLPLWQRFALIGFLIAVIILALFVLAVSFGFSGIYNSLGFVIFVFVFWISFLGEGLTFLGFGFFAIEVAIVFGLVGWLIQKKDFKNELFIRNIRETIKAN